MIDIYAHAKKLWCNIRKLINFFSFQLDIETSIIGYRSEIRATEIRFGLASTDFIYAVSVDVVSLAIVSGV